LGAWYSYNSDHAINEDFWGQVLLIRKEVNKQIEIARNAGRIGSQLEAEVIVNCNQEIYQLLEVLHQELKFIFITSNTKIALDKSLATGVEGFSVQVSCSQQPKCARCWHRVAGIDEQSLCARCKVNLTTQDGETRIYA
jgi:isoleucyl-tRNA synthetase